MKLRNILLRSVLSLFICSSAYAQSITDSYSKIEKLLAEHKIPAVGIGIIRNNKLTEVKVIGELKKGVPAPYNTLFNVASLTKPIIGMLALKLVSSGQWNLDEPVAKYWTDPDVASDPRSQRITTRHILSHQTGFKNWRYKDTLNKLAIHFEPGTQFGYSGEGLELLRIALEKKFNRSIIQLADSLVFKPFGMKDSRLIWDSSVDESRFAAWHDKEGNNTYQTGKSEKPNAADDLLTTVEDYGKFCQAVLTGFGIEKAVYKDMITPQVKIAEHDYFGLVWEIYTLAGKKDYALVHSGGDRGVQTLAVLCPLSGEGLIIFTNGDNGSNLYPALIANFLNNGAALNTIIN